MDLVKGPIVQYFGDKIKEGIIELVIDYITVLPILIGMSIGVYALLNMISSRLANLGVIAVFLYGALIVIF